MNNDFIEKVNKLRCAIKVGKTRYNSGMNFYYRNAEDILDAAKPELEKMGLLLTITDDVVEISGKLFVKAKAELWNGEGNGIETVAFAKIDVNGRTSDAQLTGAASSYARKYALNGLLCLDDAKDPDEDGYTGGQPKLPPNYRQTKPAAKTAAHRPAQKAAKQEYKTFRQKVIDYAKDNNLSLQEIKADYGIDETTTEDGFRAIYVDLIGEDPETPDFLL